MGICRLDHIPTHLHYNDKPILSEFFLHEQIYRRCEEVHKLNPFLSISLRDISVNRQGMANAELCQPQETLYNTESNSTAFYYENLIVIVLQIKEIDLNRKTYSRKFIENHNGQEIGIVIELIHEPLDCNYPHSVFRFFYSDAENDSIIVSRENYKQTLGNSKAAYSKLRDHCRTAIADMLVQGEIWINPPNKI